MTSIEAKPEGHQLSFAEAYLDSLKWDEPNTGVPLDKFLQFLQDSPIENMETYKTIKRSIEIKLPLHTSFRLRSDALSTFVTDCEAPEIRDDGIIYSPKSYAAWITRIPRPSGHYAYTVDLDTILREKFDNLQSSLKGEETPLIPATPIRHLEEETELRPIEIAVQTAFIPMPKAS
ncbi:MAG: hypothetical protein WD992_01035 [Candidatus Levyibacteriota bacterium]